MSNPWDKYPDAPQKTENPWDKYPDAPQKPNPLMSVKGAARIAKSGGSAVVGGTADLISMPYNWAATMFNKMKETELGRATLEAEGHYLEPGTPDIPTVPSAVDAVDHGVDYITGGYTQTPENEKSLHDGIKAAASMLSLSGAGKGAVKFGANKIGKTLEKFGSTKARDLAVGGVATGVTSELENKHGQLAATGEGIGAGALATAVLHPKTVGKGLAKIAKRTAFKAAGLGKKNFNTEAYEALRKLNIDAPLNVVSDSKLLKAGLQFSEYLPHTSGKIIDQNKEVSKTIQSHFKKLSDDVGVPGDQDHITAELYKQSTHQLKPEDKMQATKLKNKAAELLKERQSAGAPLHEFQQELKNYINKGEIPKADQPSKRVAEFFENGGTLKELLSKKDLPKLDRNYINSFLIENPEHVIGFLKNGGTFKDLQSNTGTKKFIKYFKENNLFETPVVVEDVPRKLYDFLKKGGKLEDYAAEFIPTVESLIDDKQLLNKLSKHSSTLTGAQSYLQPRYKQLATALKEDLLNYDNQQGFQANYRKAEDFFSANAERNKLDILIGNKVTNPKTGDIDPGQLASVILGYGKKNKELKEIKNLDTEKLNNLGEAAKHIYKSLKNIPNPSGSGVYAAAATALYGLGVAPFATIAKLGGLTGGMSWLLSPKTINTAYNFAKNPSEAKAKQLNQLFKTTTTKDLAQVFGVVSK